MLNGADTVPSMLTVNVFVVPAAMDVLPYRVNVPLLPLMTIVSDPELKKPVGKFATQIGYVPFAMPVVVTGKVVLPDAPE